LLAAGIELNAAGEFDDGFRVMPVFEEGVFDGLRAADEQAAEQTILFPGRPIGRVCSDR
jgi:hypothetical protein